MIRQLDLLIQKIEEADEVSRNISPVQLVEIFDTYYAPAIGKLMLGLRAKRAKFDFEVKDVKDYYEAFDLVKASDRYEEKVIYSLKFLGLFNRAAEKGVSMFIKKLTGDDSE